MSTNPIGNATSRIVSSTRSVATPDDFFGQAAVLLHRWAQRGDLFDESFSLLDEHDHDVEGRPASVLEGGPRRQHPELEPGG